jgi:hypothetical protein
MSRRVRRAPLTARVADPHRLYQAAVQNVKVEIDFVDSAFTSLRRRKARRLREDFCGTGNTSCEWVRRRRTSTAVGLDLNPDVLEWGLRQNVSRLPPAARRRVSLIRADVRAPPRAATGVDVVLAMNFSYFVFKTRGDLRRYFRRVRRDLVRDGVLMLDFYGGYEAFKVQRERRDIDGRFTYIWDQAEFNPVTGDIRCFIHFAFPDGSRLRRAFQYDWRAWTLPEVRELLAEAGFRRSIVYCEGDDGEGGGDGNFEPAEECPADASFIAYIVALK